MYERILVPLDGSELAAQVVPYVTEIARNCGSEVVLLQAIERFSSVLGEITGVRRLTASSATPRTTVSASSPCRRTAAAAWEGWCSAAWRMRCFGTRGCRCCSSRRAPRGRLLQVTPGPRGGGGGGGGGREGGR